MSKELFIASSPHETKVAVLDDDQLVEVFFERDTDVGLVGGIYKGRVNRVLPGMQSAFVDIGLERDAFLYVSDFFEDAEEYDKIVTEAEARVNRFTEKPAPAPEAPRLEEAVPPPTTEVAAEEAPAPQPSAAAPTDAPVAPEAPPAPPVETAPPVEAAAPAEPAPAHPPQQTQSPDPRQSGRQRDFRGHDHRGGRRRRRGRRFEQNRFQRPEYRERPAPSAPPQQEGSTQHSFEILPGESLAKYSHHDAPPPSSEAPVQQDFSSEQVHEPLPVESEALPEVAAEVAEPPASAPGADAMATAMFTPPVLAHVEPEKIRTTDETPATTVEPAPIAAPAAAEPPPTEIAAPSIASPEAESKPRFWNRLVNNFFGETPASQDDTASESEEMHENQAEAADSSTMEELAEEEETSEELEAGDSDEMDEVAEEGETAEASDTEATAQEGSQAETPAEGSTPAEPTERSYTLREPTRAPHFAPRRRRGRRGRGGRRDFRPSGPGGQGQQQRREPRAGNHQPTQISELLKEGQEILVQIAKEPLGRKGARITSHIALPGRYLVYMPTVDHIGVSRKIGSEEERLRLRNLILENKGNIPGGFIVRTAAAGRPDDELKDDIRFLSTLWADIRKKAENTKAPALLHADLNLVQRILRDTLSPDFKTIWLDSEVEFERTIEFVNRAQPSLVGHVKLYTRNTPMFEEFGIEGEIEKALKPKVWLKSGGYIVINQTEALVAIDVNTGKYVGKTNRLEDTIVKTNIDAVNEIVRQIRMRDLGGIIVVDFIDMDERRNRNKVVQALEEALRKDRAPTKVLSFNDFGLVAVTRKRVKQSLERTLCEPCSYCSGAGWIKSVTTVCNEILAEAKKMASQLEGRVVTLRVNPDVARALKSGEGVNLNEVENVLRKDVIVKSDPAVPKDQFQIFS